MGTSVADPGVSPETGEPAEPASPFRINVFRGAVNESPSRESRPRSRGLLMAAGAVTAVAALAAGVMAVRNAALRGELAKSGQRMAAVTAGLADSLRLARQYATLSAEAFDLQQEVAARESGRIPPAINASDMSSPAGGSGPLVGARPVPAHYSVEPTAEERRKAAEHLARLPRSAGIRLIYGQRDLEEAGVVAALRNRGFQAAFVADERPGTTNAIEIGEGVAADNAVQVAYQLIALGFNVRRIRRTADPERKESIELSYKRQVADWPQLTVDQLSRIAAANDRGEAGRP
jgi:hypothetical protein